VAECSACGAGVTLPSVAPEDLAQLYPQGYGPYARPANPLVALLSAAIRGWQGVLARRSEPLVALRRLGPGRGLDIGAGRGNLAAARRPGPGRGLDIGAGRGDLSAMLQARGWEMVAVEPSPRAVEAARARGIDARAGVLDTVELEPGRYDFAVFQHSLEHTIDPVEDLARLRAALRPGGLVLISVPNFGCAQRRLFGGSWFHLDVPRHRVHFTRQALRSALEQAGFEVERISTSTSTVGLPASIQYRLAGRCLFPEGVALQVATGLCALAFPLAWLVSLIGGGGDALHAVARKPLADQRLKDRTSSTSAATASAGPG
jgi:SAM-dependent methyltransferase